MRHQLANSYSSENDTYPSSHIPSSHIPSSYIPGGVVSTELSLHARPLIRSPLSARAANNTPASSIAYSEASRQEQLTASPKTPAHFITYTHAHDAAAGGRPPMPAPSPRLLPTRHPASQHNSRPTAATPRLITATPAPLLSTAVASAVRHSPMLIGSATAWVEDDGSAYAHAYRASNTYGRPPLLNTYGGRHPTPAPSPKLLGNWGGGGGGFSSAPFSQGPLVRGVNGLVGEAGGGPQLIGTRGAGAGSPALITRRA